MVALKKYKWWIVWLLGSVVLLAYLLWSLRSDDQSLYLSGPLTNGHYQIGVQCEACHKEPFSGAEGIQSACVECHAKDLEQSDDKHPKSKFTDPRNADRVEKLDARYCATCHVEHAPERTHAMGVTLPVDYCIECHQDVGEDRPSHKGLKFDTCGSAGCHNYHDNRALYEDFLVQHAGKKSVLDSPLLPIRNNHLFREDPDHSKKPLVALNHDGPSSTDLTIVREWEASAHAQSGINCSDCHQPGRSSWVDKPALTVCADCHEMEMTSFKESRHGMRIAQGLPPMQPSLARQPMKDKAGDKTMDCNACHKPHETNTVTAAVEACVGCHDDDHTRAYKASPHFSLWQNEQDGKAPAGTGVSCASCHMPRENHPEAGRRRIRVQHNPNHNLRPNEKMIRSVCLQCHSLTFSIDALADEELVKKNFRGQPSKHIESIDWAVRREKPKSENP